MRFLFLTLSLFLFSFALTSCGPDGAFDAELAKDQIMAIKNRSDIPSKEEFRELMEKHIETLDPAEQAEARRELDKFFAELPTDAELEKMVDEIAEDMPSRSEVTEAISKIRTEMPAETRAELDKVLEDANLEQILRDGPGLLSKYMDSLAVEQ